MSLWTSDRTDTAKKLWLEGQSATQIARKLNCGLSRNAVIGKLTRMGLSRHGAAHPDVVRAKKPAPAPRAKPRAPASSLGRPPAEGKLAPELGLVEAAEQAPADPDQLKTLLEKGHRECSWPIGSAHPQRGQLFCARPTAFRQPYCDVHRPAPRPQKTGDLRLDRNVRNAEPREASDSDLDLMELLA